MKPKLEYASHGPYVVEVQQKLNSLLPTVIPPLKADGKYFDKTVARVRQFQKSRGLVPNGLVGAQTWAALDGQAPPVGEGAPSSSTQTTPKPPAGHLKGVKVYSGAPMKCSYGSGQSWLRLYSGKAATMSDCKGFSNIFSFGQCKSPLRAGFPDYYENTAMGVMFDTGQTIPPPCTPVIVAPWSGSFEKGDDLAQTIDKTAYCMCMSGGRISFT